MIFHLVVTYTHDMLLALQIVRTRQCVLTWNIVQLQLFFENPASIQMFINRSGCGSFSTRSLCFCNRFSCARISIEGVGVIIYKSAGAKMDQIALPQQFSLFLFDNYCILHTNLRLFRRYRADWQKWCAKNRFNRISIGTDMYRLFFETMDWLVAPKTGCPLSLNLIIINSATVPFSWWSINVCRVPLLLRSKSEEWPTSCWKSFLQIKSQMWHKQCIPAHCM